MIVVTIRRLFPYLAIIGFLAAVAWAASRGRLPPAEFSFCNGTEIKSVDPAIVTGVPEHRIIDCLFEGLFRPDPKTLKPIPGVAERCEISPDRRTYTFHLRNAVWSDGSPITAHDFVWSWRRFLHPETGAEYAYQAWYLVNAEKYTAGRVELGDAVEIELDNRPNAAQVFPNGTILYGRLLAVHTPDGKPAVAKDGVWNDQAVFNVEIDGKRRLFSKAPGPGVEKCRNLLIDFRTVGVKASDDRTLIVQLRSPTPYFLHLTTYYPLFPVNRRCVETYGYPDWTKPENIVTNGPFLLQFRRIRDRLRMVKNPRYWDAATVGLESIDALAVNSETTMLNMYINGQVDWITDIPLPVVPELRPRSDYLAKPFLSTYFYRVNVTRPGLNDVRVRRALNLALDKREIVERVTRAGQVPAYSLVPPGIEGYTPAAIGEFDVPHAQSLLAEAGFPRGRGFPTIEILYNTTEAHQSIAEVVQRQWRNHLGIDVRLSNQEWAVFLDTTSKLEYWVARYGWTGDYPDPNTFLDMFVTNGPNNQTGWGNPEYDRLIAAAANEPDPARRFDLLNGAETILMSELPILPIYYYVTRNMVRPYVRGFHHTIQDVHPLRDVWIDHDAKRRLFAAGGQ